MWLLKENLKRAMKLLLMIAQNNTIKTHYIKVRVNKTQEKDECRICADKK